LACGYYFPKFREDFAAASLIVLGASGKPRLVREPGTQFYIEA
jgi:hypothetical protein